MSKTQTHIAGLLILAGCTAPVAAPDDEDKFFGPFANSESAGAESAWTTWDVEDLPASVPGMAGADRAVKLCPPANFASDACPQDQAYCLLATSIQGEASFTLIDATTAAPVALDADVIAACEQAMEVAFVETVQDPSEPMFAEAGVWDWFGGGSDTARPDAVETTRRDFCALDLAESAEGCGEVGIDIFSRTLVQCGITAAVFYYIGLGEELTLAGLLTCAKAQVFRRPAELINCAASLAVSFKSDYFCGESAQRFYNRPAVRSALRVFGEFCLELSKYRNSQAELNRLNQIIQFIEEGGPTSHLDDYAKNMAVACRVVEPLAARYHAQPEHQTEECTSRGGRCIHVDGCGGRHTPTPEICGGGTDVQCCEPTYILAGAGV